MAAPIVYCHFLHQKDALADKKTQLLY